MVDLQRQWRAEHQNIHIKQKVGKNKYVVNGNRGIDYQVDLRKPACECPDWQDKQPRDGCKHILKVKLNKEKITPLPSAKTDFGPPDSRSTGDYPSNWDTLRERTLERDHWECQKCGIKGGQYGSVRVVAHHIVPKSKGGEDKVDNLITLCHDCHEDEHGHSIPTGNNAFQSSSGGDCTTVESNYSTTCDKSASSRTDTKSSANESDTNDNTETSSVDSASLDKFVNDKDVSEKITNADSNQGVEPARTNSTESSTLTARIVPEEEKCKNCGEHASRLWIVNEVEICSDCKGW